MRHWKTAAIISGALCWSVASSISVFPHSLSYFNELVGGPVNGHKYLLSANIDWGQDMVYLKKWLDQHPEAQSVRMAHLTLADPAYLDAEYRKPARGPTPGAHYTEAEAAPLGPQPGWYAISVHQIHSPEENIDYFLRFQPVAMAGYSIHVYHVTLDEANRVRSQLGLPACVPDKVEGNE